MILFIGDNTGLFLLDQEPAGAPPEAPPVEDRLVMTDGWLPIAWLGWPIRCESHTRQRKDKERIIAKVVDRDVEDLVALWAMGAI